LATTVAMTSAGTLRTTPFGAASIRSVEILEFLEAHTIIVFVDFFKGIKDGLDGFPGFGGNGIDFGFKGGQVAFLEIGIPFPEALKLLLQGIDI